MRACWKIFPCVLLLSSVAVAYDVSFEQSECLPWDADAKDVIEVTVEGCDLHIEHLYVVINCCLEYAPEVEVDGSTIRVTEVDVGPPCDCICPVDLEIVVRGLEPGQYRLYFNAFLHGEPLSYDVEIPPCDDFWLYGSEVWSQMGIEDVAMPIHASNPRPVQAFSFGTRFPVEHCRVTALDLSGTVTEKLGPEFVYFDVYDPSTGPGVADHGWAVCRIVFDRVLDPPVIGPPIIDPPIADAKAMPPGTG
ncbi:MAG: hypothetical protein JXA90_03360, partial [Planctomycetes bacterium]|nr:hypothetical protein [Planctomycetota bacterium]